MDHSYMKKRYISLYETSKFNDCCFRVENEQIHSHKLILAVSSPVFEAMLFGPLASSFDHAIPIQDITTLEFKQMLTFIYTDSVQITSLLNAWALVYIAQKYLIDDLSHFCLAYIQSKLETKNILLNYEFADLFRIEPIRNLCINNVRMYANVVLNTDYHIKSDTLCELLEQDEFNINERDLIRIVIKWARIECERNNSESNHENLRSVLTNSGVLARLRFLTLIPNQTDHELIKQILKNDEIDLLHSYRLSDGNTFETERKLRYLNFSLNSNPRKTIPFVQKIGFRQMLKIGYIFNAGLESKLTTQMSVNKSIFIHGFLLPTRRASGINSTASYSEHLNLTISDPTTQEILLTITYRKTQLYDSMQTIRISDPFLFEKYRPYNVDFTWSSQSESNSLQWVAKQYALHYLSSTYISPDRSIKFEFNDPFDYGFIQGVCYCTV